jgi:hypothetical protein
MKRKRKTVKPAPKAEPKRDWMDQDRPRDTLHFRDFMASHPGYWPWRWPLTCKFTSSVIPPDMPITYPHPSEYINP